MPTLSLLNRYSPLSKAEQLLNKCVEVVRSTVANLPPSELPICANVPSKGAFNPVPQLNRSSVARSAAPPPVLRSSMPFDEPSHSFATIDPSPGVLGPYKVALLSQTAPSTVQQRPVSYWRRKVAPATGETRRERIRQKFEALKASSSPKKTRLFQMWFSRTFA